jgi:DNA-binding transcriptional MerR regulator
VKYWFSVSDAEQERRFQKRLADPTKRWKLSPMDLEARNRWVDFSRAKDAMFAATDIPEAPWWVVEAEVKKRARLNVMTHLLGQVPYDDLTPSAPELPPRPEVTDDYVRPPKESQHLVPDVVPPTLDPDAASGAIVLVQEVDVNVGQVAAAAGVSVRTLHHWDAVGLLVPSGRTAAGYRTYAPADLERLRQVLTYRELGFSLEDVRRLLDDPAVDALDHLRRQQSLLADRIARLQTVAALVARAVEARSMGIELDPHELREVFGDEDPTPARRGGARALGRHRRLRAVARPDVVVLEAGLAGGAGRGRGRRAALRRGAGRRAAGGRPVGHRHRGGPPAAHQPALLRLQPRGARLAGRHVRRDERFAAHYERRAAGLAQYVHDAVKANAAAR